MRNLGFSRGQFPLIHYSQVGVPIKNSSVPLWLILMLGTAECAVYASAASLRTAWVRTCWQRWAMSIGLPKSHPCA